MQAVHSYKFSSSTTKGGLAHARPNKWRVYHDTAVYLFRAMYMYMYLELKIR